MEKLFKQLSDTQATLFHLFQKTWIYHWDVVGPDFYQLHTVFGNQYETMFEEIDTLTEHMRYLGMRPVSTLTRVVEVSHIDGASNSNQMVDADGMVTQLLSDNKKIIEMLTDVSEEADKQKQYATANLVQSIMETHGKFVWMLRSFTEKSPKNVKEDVQMIQPEVEEEIIEEEIQTEE
jgi:starvation-inducible DNA-binding protein